jgi:hypothetical protein
MKPDPDGASDDSKLIDFGCFGPSDKVFDWIASRHWRRAQQALAHGGQLFRLGVVTALALCNHSITYIYVDVSMLRHRVE